MLAAALCLPGNRPIKQLVCYIHGPARLLLSDVKKIATRMGLKVEMYMPPKNQPHYFDDIGRENSARCSSRGHIAPEILEVLPHARAL